MFHGEIGLQQDKAEGLRWYHRAVEAGSADAAYNLGKCFWEGDGVDKDRVQALGYFRKAAELGSVPAYCFIGDILIAIGEIDEAMLNCRKAAMCGWSDDTLFSNLRVGFRAGFITKDEYAFTLREHQVACDEMKSDGRERHNVW
eukprot:CAMPEP_0172329020 /NCGR_PEP_ID=MMETSP1058-20130122/60658_1 /TAXON_ID=83371 /ORGANISM="Detonula confervacea, Strain CCMP 353" /LENGTH=143 /DNA_ID=CAMNT_0013046165 /DNA_START=334 /DNA_END=762 /DNA_ORIENTATION=-